MAFPSARRTDAGIGQRGTSPLRAAQGSPLGSQLFFLIAQMEHVFSSQMSAGLAECELDVRQYSTLAFIADGHTPTQHELAHILHLDPSQVVTLSKGLEARGLLVRKTLPTDRRAKALVITADGRALHAEAAERVRGIEESVTASLSRRDRNALKSFLERILPLS